MGARPAGCLGTLQGLVEREEFLTGSMVALRLLGASWGGLPTPFTCSADSCPVQGERPRSARTRSSIDREIQSGTYLTLHTHFLPLGTDSSWLCHKRTLRYQQTLGLSFPNNPLALLAILQGGILRPLRFSFLVLNNEAPGGELSPGYS